MKRIAGCTTTWDGHAMKITDTRYRESLLWVEGHYFGRVYLDSYTWYTSRMRLYARQHESVALLLDEVL